MNIKQIEKDNLYKGLGLFLEAFRPYLVSVLMRKPGTNWVTEFEQTLSSQQLMVWQENIRQGIKVAMCRPSRCWSIHPKMCLNSKN